MALVVLRDVTRRAAGRMVVIVEHGGWVVAYGHGNLINNVSIDFHFCDIRIESGVMGSYQS